jgi:hypothetical protein
MYYSEDEAGAQNYLLYYSVLLHDKFHCIMLCIKNIMTCSPMTPEFFAVPYNFEAIFFHNGLYLTFLYFKYSTFTVNCLTYIPATKCTLHCAKSW